MFIQQSAVEIEGVDRPGPRDIISVLYMAGFFYPKSFRNLDIEALHREYQERFRAIPYRDYYVYPWKQAAGLKSRR